MFWIPYVLFAVIVSAVIAGVWWLRRRWSPAAGAGAGVTPDFEQLVLSQLANRLPLAAMRSLLKSQPAPRTSGVCLFTADDA
ncbi:MAG: hypothetical protein NT069_16370, partial [Planctomycetota bacterium]|nr:hypothetical protein [Planctomycetota bacterium]